ncbi:ABC transporter ATP-binding protein [Micromonospora craniellae]|uniref:ATP-binding cassette domain-containing protein n=1 Tax=Micromonospora craniellae TaxID=2294034 RepID=A0A372FSV9_9ACTN|nr:ATP-binding cassette domain-containing protein [Micromonospora craniellae]QOC89651.1 ATP-binding cassette domain-containing protein [Micromonospora craniellae]RFS43610.1 ATP-binding cassette domain-containing protein [Micromonospora craniellae]
MLHVRDLTVAYPSSGPVLHAVTLTLPGPEVHAIIGPNSAGKSTLLHTIAGHLTPTTGSLHLDGDDVTGWRPETAVRAGIALTPQGRRLSPTLTVAEHFAAPRPGGGRPDQWPVDDLLDMFPGLAARWGHRAHQLCGGEQQMLTIACALRTAPRLLLVDEPTKGLAPVVADQITTVLRKLPARGVSVLVALPHATVAATVADTMHVLAAGQLLGSAPTGVAASIALRGQKATATRASQYRQRSR